MEKKNPEETKLSLPQVREILEALGEENLDQFQRRTFDYVSKFSRVDAEAAASLAKKLTMEYEIDEDEAVQIVNCMPKTVEELRVFLSAGRKIIEAAKLNAIVALLNENRKSK